MKRIDEKVTAKKRSIASFSDLAEVNDNNNRNNNINIDDNVNKNENDNENNNKNIDVNVNSNDVDDILSSITKTPANKKPTGIYFESDVLEVLQNLTKKLGRGAQSKLVNDVVKKYFIEKGFLPERRE